MVLQVKMYILDRRYYVSYELLIEFKIEISHELIFLTQNTYSIYAHYIHYIYIIYTIRILDLEYYYIYWLEIQVSLFQCKFCQRLPECHESDETSSLSLK